MNERPIGPDLQVGSDFAIINGYTIPRNDTPMTELYRGKFLGLQKTGTWEYCTRTNASAVVVVVTLNMAGQLVFTEQYRPPLDTRVIEFPAGLAGDDPASRNEALETAALRELKEEIGYEAESVIALTHGPTSAGMTDEIIHFFLARNPRQTGPGGGVAGENITVHHVARELCHQWLETQQGKGLLVDPKVYAGLYFLDRLVPR